MTRKEQFILSLLLNVRGPAALCLKVKVLHLLISPSVLEMSAIKERNICPKTVRRQASPQVRSLHKDSINTFSVKLDTHICS